jgi:hypothetical protein
MEPDTAATSRAGHTGAEVMAAIEADERERLVIADVSRDGAWLSVPVPDAAALRDWR